MNKEPTEFQYFKAWLFFFVVASVCTWLIALVLGSFLAAFLQAGGACLAQASQIIQILGVVIAIPVSYVTFRIGGEISYAEGHLGRLSRPSNQSMKPTVLFRNEVSRLPRHPAGAYLRLVRRIVRSLARDHSLPLMPLRLAGLFPACA